MVDTGPLAGTYIPAAAESRLELIFELAEPHDFDLTGEITGSGPTSRADLSSLGLHS